MARRRVLAGAIRAGVWDVDNDLASELVPTTPSTADHGPGAQVVRLPLPPGPEPTIWFCEVCELVAEPVAQRAEAEFLASEHDLVHHGRAVTAAVYACGGAA